MSRDTSTREQLLAALQYETELIDDAVHFAYCASLVATRPEVSTPAVRWFAAGYLDLALDDGAPQRFRIPSGAEIVALYSNTQRYSRAAVNLLKLTLKNAVAQSYEKIQAFCARDQRLLERFRNSPWRHFARVVRNSFSHDFRLDFEIRRGRHRGDLLPDVELQFSDRLLRLSNAQHGQEIDGNVLPVKYVLELLEMMRTFASAL